MGSGLALRAPRKDRSGLRAAAADERLDRLDDRGRRGAGGVEAGPHAPIERHADDRHEDPAEDLLEQPAAAAALPALLAPRQLARGRRGRRRRRLRRGFERPLPDVARHTLTSGTFGTVLTPPPPPGPFGLFGFLDLPNARGFIRFGRFLTAFVTSRSGFGVTGPSGYSKPSASFSFSGLSTMTRTAPPDLSLPNSTSSASGVLIVAWISRAIGRAPMVSS